MAEKFIVEISARHIHLSKKDLETLFGEGYELTPKKDLSQPNQFACEEKVCVKGSRSEMNVTILGPTRKETQLELSLTDARVLGVEAKIRESGNIEGTMGITIVGPKGEVTVDKGVIAAKRHVHMTSKDAETYNVKNGDIVNVKVESEDRETIFGDTVIRVSDSYALAMHIDTDEANAAGIKGCTKGEIVR
ncbi:MAG: phosphate propanoyltransferase [Anaerorhabdus sp.]